MGIKNSDERIAKIKYKLLIRRHIKLHPEDGFKEKTKIAPSPSRA